MLKHPCTGILLPSLTSQESLIKSMFKSASIDPNEVGYVEAHGTGTIAGDSTELSSINNAFCGVGRRSPLYVGSIKANIGHPESASGLAGVIKTCLAIEKGLIPPVPNIEQFKESLQLAERNIQVLFVCALWEYFLTKLRYHELWSRGLPLAYGWHVSIVSVSVGRTLMSYYRQRPQIRRYQTQLAIMACTASMAMQPVVPMAKMALRDPRNVLQSRTMLNCLFFLLSLKFRSSEPPTISGNGFQNAGPTKTSVFEISHIPSQAAEA